MSTPDPREADLSNWRTVPHSRWAFRNVSRLIPTKRIERDALAPDPLPMRSASLESFVLKLRDGRSMSLRTFEEETSTDAIVALVGGAVAYESYRNGMTAETLHILMSASKAITGLIAGILRERGAVDVEKQVKEYVPEAKGTAYAGATIRHLLDMRIAVAFDDAQARLYANSTNWDALNPEETGVDFLDFVKAAPVGRIARWRLQIRVGKHRSFGRCARTRGGNELRRHHERTPLEATGRRT